jgi:hypothetical protein
MRCHVRRVQHGKPFCLVAVWLVLGGCVLTAATAVGQAADPFDATKAPHGNVEKKGQPAGGIAAKDGAMLNGIRLLDKVGPGEQTIQRALGMRGDFGFSDDLLNEVIQRFAKAMGVEIHLDMKALTDANIAESVQVTFSAKAITIRSAMTLMLRPLGLRWIVDNGILLVTTPEVAESENYMETRVYAVHDLVAPRPSYRFEGIHLPGTSGSEFPHNTSSGRALGGVEGMGGGMGGMGGGMFQVADQPQSAKSKPAKPAATPAGGGGGAPPHGFSMGPRSPKMDLTFTMDDLINVIIRAVKPQGSWEEFGGNATISPAGNMLVITQTREAHEKIEGLLENLRATSPGLRVVTLRATWLALDLKQLNELLHSGPGSYGCVRGNALEAMAAKTQGYIGSIACFSGQTVHIASGRSRSMVVGAVPVVGSGAAYQPVVNNPQSGATLQVTPQLLPDTSTVLLDVCSSIARAEGPAESTRFLAHGSDAESKSDVLTLDRVKMGVVQLAATLKARLGETMLVGGLTREPSADDPAKESAAATPQLYLFITVDATQR